MSENYRLPNFIVGGAAKCGTTTLYEILKSHEQIFLPKIKESRFFASSVLKNTLGYNQTSIFDWNDFKNLFQATTEEHLAVGDFGNLYMLNPEITIRNIEKYISQKPKLVFLIRNPIERAFSAYLMAKRNFYEDCSFEVGLEKEESRLKEGYLPCDIIAYKKMGMYFEPISLFSDKFKTHVIVTEELNRFPQETLDNLYAFLGVDSKSANTKVQYNKGGYVYKSRLNPFAIQSFMKKLRPYLHKFPGASIAANILAKKFYEYSQNKGRTEKISMDPNTREYLLSRFKKDIAKTSELLDKDLFKIWNLDHGNS